MIHMHSLNKHYLIKDRRNFMSDAVILPFDSNPINQCYHHIAFPMSIVQGNTVGQDITPWLCGRCISVKGRINKQNIVSFTNSLPEDRFPVNDKIVENDKIFIDWKIWNLLEIDPTSLLKRLIAQKRYVVVLFDEFYIPVKTCYQRHHFEHDCMVYGYDDTEQVFYGAGYMTEQKYGVFKVTYEDMVAGMTSPDVHKALFDVWTYLEEAEYKLNPKKIYRELEEYLHPKLAVKKHSPYEGIQTYDMLETYYSECAAEERWP